MTLFVRSTRLALAAALAVACAWPGLVGAQKPGAGAPPAGTPAASASVPALVAALKDADPLAREKAAKSLGEMGPAAAAAIEPLIATFTDPDIYLRGAAAVALGRIGAAAVPALTRALADPNGEVRWSAAIALGRVGQAATPATPALVKALADANENVRFASAVGLGGLRASAKEAVPALTEALHDADDTVRAAARQALDQIAPGARAAQRSRDALAASVDRLVPALMSELHVPGVSVALIQDRKVAWSKAYGVKNASTKEPVTAETAFEAASMSKPIFALLAMQFVERGKLDLDRPLVEYGEEPFVPDLPARRLVTARMILTHTAGFPNWRPGGEERDGPLPLLFKPGSRYSYSGEGIFYLQRVVERIAGLPLDRLAVENLFKPLGLTHSDYGWTPAIETHLATGHDDAGTVRMKTRYQHPNAAYSLYTTAEDYARLLVEVLEAERGNSRLVSQKSVREMLRHQLRLESGEPIERPGDAQGLEAFRGLGWSITTTAQGDIAHHGGSNGSGFRCFSQFSPSRGTGIAIFTNGTKGGELWTRLIATMGDM